MTSTHRGILLSLLLLSAVAAPTAAQSVLLPVASPAASPDAASPQIAVTISPIAAAQGAAGQDDIACLQEQFGANSRSAQNTAAYNACTLALATRQCDSRCSGVIKSVPQDCLNKLVVSQAYGFAFQQLFQVCNITVAAAGPGAASPAAASPVAVAVGTPAAAGGTPAAAAADTPPAAADSPTAAVAAPGPAGAAAPIGLLDLSQRGAPQARVSAMGAMTVPVALALLATLV